MWKKIRDGARDAYDIAKRAKSGTEIARALVPQLQQPRILNEVSAVGVGDGTLGSTGGVARIPAAELIRELRAARNALKGSIPEGRVDYEALRDADAFAELRRLAPALRHLRPDEFESDAARTAFFINLYNVLAIHGVLALGIRESVMEVPSFFSVVRYRVGSEALSLDQIENGILRCNAGHPATGRPTLDPKSPALQFAPAAVDPRIHAALVCASTSCPPVGFYDADQLDAQLELATANYVNSEVHVDADGRITLPITFRYYAEDWGTREDVEAFAMNYADPGLRGQLQTAADRGAPFVYGRYDWSLNVV